MARETREERLQKEINTLDDTIYSLEQPETDHIKNVYFNAKGQHFFIARESGGKLYTRLALGHVDVTGNKPYPKDKDIAYKPEDGSVSQITVFVPPIEPDCLIVETKTKKQALQHFKDLYDKLQLELRQLEERALKLYEARGKK